MPERSLSNSNLLGDAMNFSDDEITQLVYVSNSTEKEVSLVLEPWGENVVMKPKTEQRVLVGGLHNKGSLRVDLAENQIIVSAWDGITLLVVWDDT
jgi:hypothetical protein